MASLADGWTQKAIGGTFPSGSPVACASRNSSTIDSFVIGTDGKVYNSYWTTGNDWSGINDDWRDIGGDFTPGSKVTAIARSPDNMDLFVVGKDGKVYSAYWYCIMSYDMFSTSANSSSAGTPAGTGLAYLPMDLGPRLAMILFPPEQKSLQSVVLRTTWISLLLVPMVQYTQATGIPTHPVGLPGAASTANSPILPR